MKRLKENMAPRIMNVFHLLIGLFLLIGFEARAQVSVQTDGVPENVESVLSSQAESFLNSFLEEDLSTYSPEILSEEMKVKLADLELITDGNALNTIAVRNGEGYEIWGIQMKSTSEQNGIEEVVLAFSSSTELTKVRFGDELSNTAWILARDLKVSDSGTKYLLNEILESYENILETKNDSALKTLFIEGGFVISSKESEEFDGFEFFKDSNLDYVNRLSANIFRGDNDIHIYLDNANMYHHPVFNDVYGISVKQIWNSTFYADQGHLFFVVDNRGEQPQIYSRIWQKDAYNQVDYLVKELDKYEVFLSHKNLLSNDISRSFDGEIEFMVSGEPSGLMTPELLVAKLENGDLRIDGIELKTSHLELSEGNLVVPFTAKPENREQFVKTKIHLTENSTLEELNTTMKLYTDRRNVIEVEAGKDVEAQDEPNYYGPLDLAFNTDSVSLKVRFETGRELIATTIVDSSASFELVEGLYLVNASKPGYSSVQDTVGISKSDKSTKTIVLKSLSPEPVVSTKSKGFIAKNKYWLIGGAAAVVSSTALILSTGGSESPGIPIPPGRPGMN